MRARLAGTLFVVGLLVSSTAGLVGSAAVVETPFVATAASTVSFVGDAAVAQNSSSLSVSVPTGVQTGDRLVLFVSLNAADRQVSTPSGGIWTALGDRTSRTMRTLAWSKLASASDVGGRVTVRLSAQTKATLHLAAYRGTGTDPIVASAVDTTTSLSRRTPSLAAPGEAWVVSYWASKSAAITSWTAPAAVTARRQAANSGSGRIASLLADSGAAVAAGSYGGLVATSNATSSAATMWTVALPAITTDPEPVADFTFTCSGLTCAFTASPSPGASPSYTWDWGDGSTGTGATATHAFPAAGTYAVSLTVSQSDGATAVATRDVTVTVGAPGVSEVTADVETTPVSQSGDAADDPAVWVHPADPAASLVIGNDKQGALEVYDLTGARVQRITTGTSFWGNVDVRQGVTVGSQTLDVVVAYNSGLRTFTVDPATRLLQPVGDGTGSIPTNGGEGLCAYHSASGTLYVFVITRGGRVRQYRIHDADGDTRLEGALVREFEVGSESEGCVADDPTGRLYVSEEDTGLWRYDAEPTGGSGRVLVDTVGPGGHLAYDVEGVTIAAAGPGSGYLIVSAQNGAQSDRSYFTVYDLATNAYLKSFRITTGTTADGCERTDGIAAHAGDLGPAFPMGVFICQDNGNTAPGVGNQDFKLTRLERILP